MSWKGWWWGKVLATVLGVQAVGCSSDEQVPVPSVPQEQTPPAAQEPPPAPPEHPAPAPACEGLLPAQLGPSRSIVMDAFSPEDYCGSGTSDGAGFLALLDSTDHGVDVWQVVSGEGIATGNRMGVGDAAGYPEPQPQGFLVSKYTYTGEVLMAFSSLGEKLNHQQLTDMDDDVPSVAYDPQGGALVAVWKTRPGNLQVLTYRFFDAVGGPLGETTELGVLPLDENRDVVAGVDTQGRALLLWPEPGGRSWAGQWLSRHGGPLTQPFTFPAPAVSASFWVLSPLAGGGLALRGEEQWVARFPSGETVAQPAPAWLASHPGSSLTLIRNQQANVLAPLTTMSGAGCQQSLLVFASDGTACGELVFPSDGRTCSPQRLNVGRDGTVIQQVGLSAQSTPQCSWRWWPGLLR
jgi:hypothetical protein